MEGMRDVALADYENLPDEEKAKIHNDFKQLIANGSSTVSDYIEFFHKFQPHLVDKLLQNCEGYHEGRLDFNDFITVKYILEKHVVVECDGCSSLLLGRTYFSCYECFLDFSHESYDLCSGCYRSKKFEDHNHKEFYDNEKLLRQFRSMVAEEKEDLETRNNRITQAVIEFTGKLSEYAGDRVLNFDKNKKFGRYSEEPGDSEEDGLPLPVEPDIDLLGMGPSPQPLWSEFTENIDPKQD